MSAHGGALTARRISAQQRLGRAREGLRIARAGAGNSLQWAAPMPRMQGVVRMGLGALSPSSEQELAYVMENLNMLESQLWDAEAEADQFGAGIDTDAIKEAHLGLVDRLTDLQFAIPTLDESAVSQWKADAEQLRKELRDLVSRALTAATGGETRTKAGGLIIGLVAATAVAVSTIYLLSRRVKV